MGMLIHRHNKPVEDVKVAKAVEVPKQEKDETVKKVEKSTKNKK